MSETIQIKEPSSRHKTHQHLLDVASDYRRTEAGAIPEDWDVLELDSVTKVIDGDRGRHYPSVTDFSESGYCLFLNAGNVTNEGFNFEDCAFITQAKDQQLRKGKLKRKDIVLTTRGTIGNFAFYDDTVSLDHLRINSGMVILRNENPEVDKDFLYFQLRSYSVEKQIERLAFGSAQPQLTVKGISKLLIAVPPRQQEQHAIAEALLDVDDLLTALDALIEKKRAIKQGAMQQLLTGKTRLGGFTANWEKKTLADLASFFKGSGLSKAQVIPDGRQRCIHYGELFTTYSERIAEVLNGTDADREFFRSVGNDVLMPSSDVTPNGLATASCIVESGVILGGDILVIRAPSDVLNGEFLAYAIAVHRNQVMKLVSGTTVFHLYGRDMAGFRFLAPSVEEQTAIVRVLSDMEVEISALEARLVKTRAIKQGMMQQLLTGRIRLVKPQPAEGEA
ncbi:MAG TPA: restriction endonuclease subunit S [Pyrinomonadaceae bacterium]